MRNPVFAINVTLDGCCDHNKVNGGDEILDHFTRLMREVDVLVYGRKTYQLMVPFWPDEQVKNILAGGVALPSQLIQLGSITPAQVSAMARTGR